MNSVDEFRARKHAYREIFLARFNLAARQVGVELTADVLRRLAKYCFNVLQKSGDGPSDNQIRLFLKKEKKKARK